MFSTVGNRLSTTFWHRMKSPNLSDNTVTSLITDPIYKICSLGTMILFHMSLIATGDSPLCVSGSLSLCRHSSSLFNKHSSQIVIQIIDLNDSWSPSAANAISCNSEHRVTAWFHSLLAGALRDPQAYGAQICAILQLPACNNANVWPVKYLKYC